MLGVPRIVVTEILVSVICVLEGWLQVFVVEQMCFVVSRLDFVVTPLTTKLRQVTTNARKIVLVGMTTSRSSDYKNKTTHELNLKMLPQT